MSAELGNRTSPFKDRGSCVTYPVSLQSGVSVWMSMPRQRVCKVHKMVHGYNLKFFKKWARTKSTKLYMTRTQTGHTRTQAGLKDECLQSALVGLSSQDTSSSWNIVGRVRVWVSQCFGRTWSLVVLSKIDEWMHEWVKKKKKKTHMIEAKRVFLQISFLRLDDWGFKNRECPWDQVFYFGHLTWTANSLEKTLMLGKIEGKKRGGGRGWDGWMASLAQSTWELV